jgi:hypothetical protein
VGGALRLCNPTHFSVGFMAAPTFSMLLAALGSEDNDMRARAESHWFAMVKADVVKVGGSALPCLVPQRRTRRPPKTW